MINWCAYCQQYQGETAPFDDFSLSHGMCAACENQGLDMPEEKFQSILLLKSLQDRLWVAGKSEDKSLMHALVADAILANVRPIDILVGLLAPLLYQIGEDWAQGKTTVADEHRFTAFAFDVLATVRAKFEGDFEAKPDGNVRVLLLNADGNYHSLGVQVLELFLRSAGIPAKAIFPGLPAEEVINLAVQLKPEWIGFSISLATQVPSVIETVNKVIKYTPALSNKIFLGGQAVKMDSVPTIPGTIQITELGSMLKFLRQIKPTGAQRMSS